jgi:hypothetical protein
MDRLGDKSRPGISEISPFVLPEYSVAFLHFVNDALHELAKARDPVLGALFITLLSGATTRVSARLSKSHDTPQKVIKEQRLSWKN